MCVPVASWTAGQPPRVCCHQCLSMKADSPLLCSLRTSNLGSSETQSKAAKERREPLAWLNATIHRLAWASDPPISSRPPNRNRPGCSERRSNGASAVGTQPPRSSSTRSSLGRNWGVGPLGRAKRARDCGGKYQFPASCRDSSRPSPVTDDGRRRKNEPERGDDSAGTFPAPAPACGATN